MAAYSALPAVSAAVFAALNVSAYLTFSPGGVRDDVVLGTAYPFTLYSVIEHNLGGLGTRAGTTRTLEIDLRLHVFTQQGGWSRAHTAMAKAIELLRTPPAVTGFGSWAIVHDETIPLRSEVVSGVVVNELVANMRLWVTEA